MSGACLAAKCDSRGSLYKAVRVARQFATNKALAQAETPLNILNVSAFAAHVSDSFIPDRHRRYTVRSPIGLTQGEPVAVARNQEFVFIGRMTEEKGVRQLASAARKMGLPVTFVGSGPLLEEIRSHGGMIRCEGWVDAQDVNNILKRARALVFPSTWYETGGLVVLEALARGVPVIVSRQTAAADFVVDGENGYLIDPADPTALQMAMMKLLDDAVVERLGRSAYDRYWANPQSTEAHVSELLRVYRGVLSEHRLHPAGRPPS
jgi:glycosyltransferase involved in cell wall biosynthesis